jgi:hypothetical protein
VDRSARTPKPAGGGIRTLDPASRERSFDHLSYVAVRLKPPLSSAHQAPTIGLVSLRAGIHKLGPDTASLVVKTYREGLAAKAGHDLIQFPSIHSASSLTAGSSLNVEARCRP